MIKTLHKMGVRSSHMYVAGLCSIGLAAATWAASKNFERAGLSRADRWGIFVGEWAPTFFAMGVALRIEETHREVEEPRAEMFEPSERVGPRTRAGV
jgi:hypothetical protein